MFGDKARREKRKTIEDELARLDQQRPGRLDRLDGRRVYAITARPWRHGWELSDGDKIITQAASLADAPGEVRDYLATEHGGEPEDDQVTVTAGHQVRVTVDPE